jgi:hypothetical protein
MAQVTLKITKNVGFKPLKVILKNNIIDPATGWHTQNVEQM